MQTQKEQIEEMLGWGRYVAVKEDKNGTLIMLGDFALYDEAMDCVAISNLEEGEQAYVRQPEQPRHAIFNCRDEDVPW